MKKLVLLFACATMVLTSCGPWSNLAKGSAIGGGSGAAVGAGVGALIGKDAKSAAIGSAIGAIVGTGVGAIIGDRMDKKAAELAAIEGAQVETVTDVNNLTSVKVTFDNGILFDFNKSELSDAAKQSLKDFAQKMADMPETDITIWGHTDNIGTEAANQSVSQKRANAVKDFLASQGIAADRLLAEGKSFNMPVATNDTADGRAQNRRVEVYISANEAMIAEAQAEADAK
ncbi:MAG: OmpA family protein [Bacteroidales bacterium]|jgi:outer membrane protein OmpA-like peptidoglycan-associated protein|nr:OmpA family protein [Bacteroidales bacterium]